MIKTVRALYKWAMERDEISHNPAAGIGAIAACSGADALGGIAPAPRTTSGCSAKNSSTSAPWRVYSILCFSA